MKKLTVLLIASTLLFGVSAIQAKMKLLDTRIVHKLPAEQPQKKQEFVQEPVKVEKQGDQQLKANTGNKIKDHHYIDIDWGRSLN
jgi:cell division protein FtsB